MSDAGATVPLDADSLLLTVLEHGAEFVVIGGLAVAAHGYIGATKDVDIVPEPGQRNIERLFSALQSIDVVPLEAEDFRPEELPFGLAGAAVIDVPVVGTVAFAGYEDLVAMKKLRAGPRTSRASRLTEAREGG